jgi:ATP-binding cassette subfamily B protein
MEKTFRELLEMPKRVYRSLSGKIRFSLLTALFLMVITGFLTSLPPVIIGALVDRLLALKENESLVSLAFNSIVWMAVIILFREFLQVVRKFLVENAATRLEKQLFVDAVAHTLQIDFSQTQNSEGAGALNGRILRSVEGFVRLIKLGFLDFFPVVFAAGFSLLIAFRENLLVGGAMALVIPCGLAVIIVQIWSQNDVRVKLLRAKEKSDGKVIELLQGREYVRAVHTEDIEVENIENIAETLRKRELKHHIYMAFFDAAKYLNEGFFSIAVLLLSIYLLSTGAIKAGDVLKFTLLYASVLIPLRDLHRILDEAHESSIRVADYFKLLDKPRDISYDAVTNLSVEPAHTAESLIEFENVHFSYPGRQSLLKGISFKIDDDGAQVAFAGGSGSGKSTLLKLLLRLQHTEDGRIFIKGRDIRSFSRKEIAELFGYVGQEPFLLAGTIYENIAYGFRGDLTQEKIIAAAKQANVHDEIMAMPERYKTELNEGGRKLSGGQRQRVAIARVFLHNPPILLLDEATSGLDIQNEQIVQEALNQAMQGRTVISISHRLSALQNADRILLIDGGKIIAEGDYEYLVTRNEVFSALVGLENKNNILKEEMVF